MQKATMKDIAREAGVSVATVSYVLNNREDQKISDSVKQKILQIVNLLSYTPNPFAKSLSEGRTRNVVFRTSADAGFLKKVETMCLLDGLYPALRQSGYRLLYMPDKDSDRLSNADAVICFDMPRAQFYSLGDKNFIPLIVVDGLINDPLFFQITPDYGKIKAAADARFDGAYTYAAITPENAEQREAVLSAFKSVVFVSDIADLAALRNSPEKNYLLTQVALFDAFSALPNLSVFKYDAHLQIRLNSILDGIEYAIARAEGKEHFIRV
jgi:DNA-binding LacI/PurR family transcriptional regulator